MKLELLQKLRAMGVEQVEFTDGEIALVKFFPPTAPAEQSMAEVARGMMPDDLQNSGVINDVLADLDGVAKKAMEEDEFKKLAYQSS